MTSLVQIIYVSKAAPSLDADGLERLRQHAARRNAEDGITGVLLLRGGRFVQVLEGPVPAVDRCFERIAMDDRHHDLLRTLRAPITERSFPRWALHVVEFDHGADPHIGEFFVALRGGSRQSALAAELLRQLNFGRAGAHSRFS